MAGKNLPVVGGSVDTWGQELNDFLSEALVPSGPTGGDIKPAVVAGSNIKSDTITDSNINSANKDGAIGTPSMRTLGTGATQASPGNHHSNNLVHSGNLIVTGNLQVDGSTTTINSTVMDVDDANITVNKGGNQATANSSKSGITVEMSDATDAVIGYNSSATSKFIVGAVGSEKEIATISDIQTLSNKTLNSTTVIVSGGPIGNSVNTTNLKTLTDGSDADSLHTHPSLGTDLTSHINDTTTHGVTGDIVGTSDVQSLSNKTIDANFNTVSGLRHGTEVDNFSSGVHGVGGDVVGTIDFQTLSNKTFSDRVYVSSTNSESFFSFPGADINITYSQPTSGSTVNNDIRINRTETSVSSGAQSLIRGVVNGITKFRVDNKGEIIGNTLSIATSATALSGSIYGVYINPTYNQATSGSATNTDLLIDRTETVITSGSQYLIDAKVGGNSKFSVDSSGNLNTSGTVSYGGSTITAAVSALNQALDGITTNVTSGNLNTLTSGVSGDADSLHTHNSFAKINVANIWTKSQVVQQITLTDSPSGTVTVDASLSNTFTLDVSGSTTRTLGNPTGLSAGGTYIFNINQGAGGSDLLTYDTLYKFPGGTVPSLSTAASAKDTLTCTYDGVILRCQLQKDFK